MLGAIIGDIVGSRLEFNNHRSKDFELFGKGCSVTDDSVMTLAVAKALMETEKGCGSDVISQGSGEDFVSALRRQAVKYMQQIGRRYPACGYGGMFYRWMFNDKPQPYNSYGNGAAMRISPAGFAARTMQEAAEFSAAITCVTHNHAEGIKGAEATSVSVYLARQGTGKAEIRELIARDYYPLDFTIDEIRPAYRFNVTCQGTVPLAVTAFLESSSFEDAIRTAVSLGGDSDTLAAITGAIAQAHYGIPSEIRSRALTFLDKDLRRIYDEWEAFMLLRGLSQRHGRGL